MEKPNIQMIKINQLRLNDQNPRFIRDHKFKKLVKSIQSFGKMLEIRPIVVDENMMILGGNMRFRACKAAGLDEIPVMIVSGLSDAEKNEFVVKDNVGFGEWDFEMLGNQFEHDQLLDWGMDVPTFDESDVKIPTPEQKEPDVFDGFIMVLKITHETFPLVKERIENICLEHGITINIS